MAICILSFQPSEVTGPVEMDYVLHNIGNGEYLGARCILTLILCWRLNQLLDMVDKMG